MNSSWLDRPWFFPVAVGSALVGHAFDLMGTYQYQPHFEHEANPLYVALQPYGFRLTWPLVIAAKLVVWLVGAVGLALFLRRRRAAYPPPPATFREFLTGYFYGRPLTWAESFYKFPRSLGPAVWATLALFCLSGPLYLYFGYGNLAARYRWWHPGGFQVGRYWFDWGFVAWAVVAIPAFGWLLWRDYRAGNPRPAAGVE